MEDEPENRWEIMFVKSEKQKTGLFGSRNIFWISTQPEGWMVNRRASDFEWLAQRLQHEFIQLKIPNFTSKEPEDVKLFVELLNSHPILFRSTFLIWFLSCTSEKVFYDRKDKEFNKGFLKELVSKITPDQAGQLKPAVASKEKNNITALMDQMNMEDKHDDISVHLFLEDLTMGIKSNREVYKELAKHIEEISFLMVALNEEIGRAACCFGKLNTSFVEIEKHKISMVQEVKPSLSSIYLDLKKSFYQWNNSMESHRSQLDKLFLPQLTSILEGSKELSKVTPSHAEPQDSQGHHEAVFLLCQQRGQ